MKTLAPGLPRTLAVAIGIGLSAACVICSYEGIRSSSNTLFKEAYGKENLPLVMSLSPFVVLALLYGYGLLLSRLGPRRTLAASTMLSALSIAACYFAVRSGNKPATAVLYFLREAYIVILLEQYWSFINSRLMVGEAQKLNGPICALGSCGGTLGGFLITKFSHTLGTEGTLLITVVSLVPALIFGELTYRICGEPAPDPESKPTPHKALALHELKRYPMLLCIFGIILCTQAVAAMLELTFQNQLSAAYANPDDQTAASGNFWMWVNLLSLASQLVLTPLLCSFVRLTWIHFAIPILNLLAIGLLLAQPSLEYAFAAYLLFKTLDYSLFKAAKEILYIPFPFDARYRAKEFIDAFGYRFGKGLASVPFAIFNAPMLGVWLGLALGAAAGWLGLVIPLARFWKRGPESTSMPAQTEASAPQ